MRHKAHKNQRGIALFISIFALLLLTAVAMGLMFLADTETNINNNYRITQQASTAAWGGLQEVRDRMMLINVAPHLLSAASVPALPGAVPNTATAASVMYLMNPVPGDVVPDPTNSGNRYFDTELCHESFLGFGGNPGTNVPCAVSYPGGAWMTAVNSDNPFFGTNATPSYKWVRINWKINNSLGVAQFRVQPGQPDVTAICWDGAHQIPMPAGNVFCEDPAGKGPQTTVYQLTSLAVTPTGARRMAQMEVAQQPPMITNAAVDSQDHVTLNGQLTVNGYDACSCACTTDKNGVTTCTNQPGKICDNTKWAIYSAGTVDNPNNSEQIIAGPNPPIAQNQQWKYDIPSLINNYKTDPNAIDAAQSCYTGGPIPCGYTCTGSPTTCGTQAGQQFGVPPTFPPTPPDSPVGPANMAQQVTYVKGNLQITGGSIGNGVLVVDGDLDIHGGLQFYGLILVKGVISFTGGGADKVNIYGSVLAGQESKVDTVLGGSAVINFDYCALPKGAKNRPPMVLSYRELNY